MFLIRSERACFVRTKHLFTFAWYNCHQSAQFVLIYWLQNLSLEVADTHFPIVILISAILLVKPFFVSNQALECKISILSKFRLDFPLAYGHGFLLTRLITCELQQLTGIRHGLSGSHRSHPLMNQGIWLQFCDFLIAQVFLIYLTARI